jgi:integrase
LQNEVEKMFQQYSKVSRKEEGKKTKKDVQKGLKAEGVWSINTYKHYLSKSKSFLKYCVEKHNVQKLGDIKPGMVVSFIETHIAKNSSPKTIGAYMSAIKKMGEFGVESGIKSFKKLASARAQELVPEYNSDEYRRGKKGGYTIKDVQILAKKAEENFSPLHRAAIEVFGFSGPRMDEFLKIKWRHLDFENNRIYLTDSNMTKGNRPRFLPVNEKTMQRLKEIHDLGLHSNDDERIWGSRMDTDDVRNFIKECARLGKTKYSGVHDFRRSTVHYHKKLVEKEFKKGDLTKEKLVDKIMELVGVDPRLNPLVEKKVVKRDSNGNIVYKTRKDSHKYPAYEKLKDENGQVVKKHKYIKEEMMERRIDYIKNLYLSQILGHNRTDITAIYKK